MRVKNPKPERLAKRRRRILVKRLIIVLIGITALLGGIISFLRLPALAIKDIQIWGTSVLDNAEIKIIAETVLRDNFAGVFPRKNFLVYPRRLLKKTLSKHFQRIDQMSFEILENNVLAIEIKERQSKYLWCGPEPAREGEEPARPDDPGRSGGCFFVDAQGYIFDQAPYFSGNAYFRIFGFRYAPPASYIGSRVSPSEKFARLMEFRQTLENLKFTPVYLWFKKENECVMRDSSGFDVFFLCDENLKETAENLRVALQAEPFAPDYAERLPDLSYLDLRHDNKVFFKFE